MTTTATVVATVRAIKELRIKHKKGIQILYPFFVCENDTRNKMKNSITLQKRIVCLTK